LLRAFQSRNYRLFFTGQSISLVGTWMQQVAMSWLVYRLTGSAAMLGLVGFAGQIPSVLISPLAGVLADRWNRRRIILATQTLAMIQATVLSLFVLTDVVQVWHIVALSALLGVINAFDIPVRQSFLVELVEKKEDLSNAIALNSAMINSARLIGPSIAGMIVASLGEGICFVVNGLSYLAVIAAVGAMRLPAAKPRKQPENVIVELREGFSYVFGFRPIRNILALLALVSLMGMPYSVLMPVVAKEVLHGGAYTYGFLIAAAGAGSFGSTIYLASRKNVLGLCRVIAIAAALFGVGLMGLAFSRVMIFSLPFLVLAGFGAMAQIAASNTMVQTIVDDDKRGRAMSFFTMSFMGMVPFGSLMAAGITSLLAIQVLINICVVTGSIPPTGVSLPFFSAGSSSLVIFMCAMGILLNISKSCTPVGRVKRRTPKGNTPKRAA